MKKSELKAQIREEIIEILSEELSPAEANAKKSAIAAAQEMMKDAQSTLTTAKTPLQKKAAQDQMAVAKEKLAQANALKEVKDDEDEEVEKEPSKSDIKKAEKELGAGSKHAKKLTSAEEERYEKLKKGISSKVSKLEQMSKSERAKSDDLKILKQLISKKEVKDLFKAKGADLAALVGSIVK